MGTSFTEYNKFGFWSKDELLSCVLFLISQELKKINSPNKFIIEQSEELYLAATTGFSGCIPDHIYEFDTKEKLALLKEVLISIINGLQVDNYLTIKDLNDNEVDGSSNWSNINRIGIEGTAKLILQLLDGNLKTNASSKIDYWPFLE